MISGMKTSFNNTKLKVTIVGSGHTQKDIHDKIGIHRNTISQWVRGIATPSPNDLYRVLLVCGYTPDEIAQLKLVDFYPFQVGD